MNKSNAVTQMGSDLFTLRHKLIFLYNSLLQKGRNQCCLGEPDMTGFEVILGEASKTVENLQEAYDVYFCD